MVRNECQGLRHLLRMGLTHTIRYRQSQKIGCFALSFKSRSTLQRFRLLQVLVIGIVFPGLVLPASSSICRRPNTDFNGLTTAFSYDIMNRMVTKSADPVHPSRLHDHARTLIHYTYGHDLISQTDNGQTTYYNYDGLGSIRGLTDTTDTTGTLTDTFDYDAWGNLIARSGTTPNLYLFTGEQFDEDLGMYYLRARYMNPGTGRFWSLDTFEGRSGEPLTLHKYLYANGLPNQFVDPSGNSGILARTVAWVGATARIGGISVAYRRGILQAVGNS